MFCMLYMVISLKSEVRRLEARWLAFTIQQLKRKGLGSRNKAIRAICRDQRLNRTI